MDKGTLGLRKLNGKKLEIDRSLNVLLTFKQRRE